MAIRIFPADAFFDCSTETGPEGKIQKIVPAIEVNFHDIDVNSPGFLLLRDRKPQEQIQIIKNVHNQCGNDFEDMCAKEINDIYNQFIYANSQLDPHYQSQKPDTGPNAINNIANFAVNVFIKAIDQMQSAETEEQKTKVATALADGFYVHNDLKKDLEIATYLQEIETESYDKVPKGNPSLIRKAITNYIYLQLATSIIKNSGPRQKDLEWYWPIQPQFQDEAKRSVEKGNPKAPWGEETSTLWMSEFLNKIPPHRKSIMEELNSAFHIGMDLGRAPFGWASYLNGGYDIFIDSIAIKATEADETDQMNLTTKCFNEEITHRIDHRLGISQKHCQTVYKELSEKPHLKTFIDRLFPKSAPLEWYEADKKQRLNANPEFAKQHPNHVEKTIAMESLANLINALDEGQITPTDIQEQSTILYGFWLDFVRAEANLAIENNVNYDPTAEPRPNDMTIAIG